MIEAFAPNPNVMAVVRVKDGQTIANSRDVAAFFHKQHKDVLKRYDTLDCSPEFNGRNFAPVDYTDEKGEARRSVDMTRDGFAFIVMGFTGKRAAKFKEDFIAAYNAAEAELRKRDRIAIDSPAQGELALAMSLNDSLANIERETFANHRDLIDRLGRSQEAVISTVISRVGHTLADLIRATQKSNEDRFRAIYERDRLLIQRLEAKQDVADCVSIAVAQTMMGVPASHLSSRLSRNLSDNARHWFAAKGFTARPDIAHAKGPWVFQRSKIDEWWAASGKAIFERATPPRSADVLPFEPKRGPAA